jgi:hypothetical protein
MRKKPPRHLRSWAAALGQRRAARARWHGAWERAGRRWAPWAPAPSTGRVACPKSLADQRHREATVNTPRSTQRSVRAIDSEAARAATRADASWPRGVGRAAHRSTRPRSRRHSGTRCVSTRRRARAKRSRVLMTTLHGSVGEMCPTVHVVSTSMNTARNSCGRSQVLPDALVARKVLCISRPRNAWCSTDDELPPGAANGLLAVDDYASGAAAAAALSGGGAQATR